MFGELLRKHRRAAELTQEALARRAGISSQAVGALERGDRRFPQRHTTARLADALDLTADLRAVFLAAASRPAVPRLPAARTAQGGAPDVCGPPPRQLPPPVAHFTGRQPDLARLVELLRPSGTVAVAAIVGMGGVGKTALAVYTGHSLAEYFPDGQLYLDLHGAAPGAPMAALDALCQLAQALGVPRDEMPTDIEQATARYRTSLAGRRVLLILDNAEDPGQVAPLLPGMAGCAAIITSRRTLSILPQVHHLPLDLLTAPEGLQLLTAIVGHTRVQAEPAAAASVVRHCGRLPLGIQLAGARLASRPHWPLGYLAERLADQHRRLDELQSADIGVRASFAVSIDQLAASADPWDQRAAAAYTLMSIPDSPDISLPVAARLLGSPEPDAERHLEHLVDLHLLETPVPGRYRMHDLLRAYGSERAAATVPATERAAALARTLELYAGAAWRSMVLILPDSTRGTRWADPHWATDGPDFRDPKEAFAWLDDHRPHLVGAATQAMRTPGVPPELVVRLAVGLFGFYLSRSHRLDWSRVCQAALDAAAKGGDRLAEAVVRMDLGLALVDLARAGTGDYEAGLARLRASLASFESLGDQHWIAACLTNLGESLETSGDLAGALACGERSLAIHRALVEPYGEAVIYERLGILYGKAGDPDRQVAYHRKSLAINERIGNLPGLASNLRLIGANLRINGCHDEALRALRRSVRLHHQVGDALGESTALTELGRLHLDLGEHAAALQLFTEALTIAEKYDDRHLQATVRRHRDTALHDLPGDDGRL